MPDQRDMSAQTNNRGLSIHMTVPCCHIFMAMLLKRLNAATGFNDLAAVLFFSRNRRVLQILWCWRCYKGRLCGFSTPHPAGMFVSVDFKAYGIREEKLHSGVQKIYGVRTKLLHILCGVSAKDSDSRLL